MNSLTLTELINSTPLVLRMECDRLLRSGAVDDSVTALDIYKVALENLANCHRETENVKNLRHF